MKLNHKRGHFVEKFNYNAETLNFKEIQSFCSPLNSLIPVLKHIHFTYTLNMGFMCNKFANCA